MTVYVLTRGEYSDTVIIGVFSTKEAAEVVAAELGDSSDIEGYELDERVGYRAIEYHRAVIAFGTGEVTRVAGWGHKILMHPARCEVTTRAGRATIDSPISMDHAVKVAAEKRQEWLRTRPPA